MTEQSDSNKITSRPWGFKTPMQAGGGSYYIGNHEGIFADIHFWFPVNGFKTMELIVRAVNERDNLLLDVRKMVTERDVLLEAKDSFYGELQTAITLWKHGQKKLEDTLAEREELRKRIKELTEALKTISHRSDHGAKCKWHNRSSLSNAKCDCGMWDHEELIDKLFEKHTPTDRETPEQSQDQEIKREAKCFLEGREAGIREAAARCDVDWPKGMPAQAIEYGGADTLKERILDLLKDKQ